MSRIPQSFIDELIARADIVEIIGLRVPLKKAGREYKACCPFHTEKTPSFWVSPDKQFYHCFGCAAHGTALGFLMAYDRLTFPEAIEELAERLGLEVPHEAAAAGSAAVRVRLAGSTSSNSRWPGPIVTGTIHTCSSSMSPCASSVRSSGPVPYLRMVLPGSRLSSATWRACSGPKCRTASKIQWTSRGNPAAACRTTI